MDKIGNIGDIKTGNFYTRVDWGQPDHPSIWAEGVPSELPPETSHPAKNLHYEMIDAQLTTD